MNYEQFNTYWNRKKGFKEGKLKNEGYSKEGIWKLIEGIQKTPISDFFKDSISLKGKTKTFFEKAKKDIWVLKQDRGWSQSAYGPPISGIKTDFGYFTKFREYKRGKKIKSTDAEGYSCVKFLGFFFERQDKDSEFFNVVGFHYKSAFILGLMEAGWTITNYNPNNIVFINWNVNPMEVKE